MSTAFQLFQFPLPSSSSVVLSRRIFSHYRSPADENVLRHRQRRRNSIRVREHLVLASKEETTELTFSLPDNLDLKQPQENKDEDGDGDEEPPTPEDLENVLALLKKNRDMLFSEVKLTISIEDPRELERRRLLGIEDPDSPSREDLADALEVVNEGKVPADRVALQLLAEEMINWPNVEVEIKKTKPSKSLYAKATDTGVNPQVAAKRLNVDWDSAATINNTKTGQETDVPAALGFGALYLVSVFPIIIDPKLNTVMKNETAHKVNQRPKKEQNSKSRESSIKKGCHCLALRPEMLKMGKPDTETAHKEKQSSKEKQNSESRESSVKKGCPCLAIRPGVTSRKVFSVCSSSLSANLPNTHKQKRVNQGLASPVQSKKPENWHSPCHYLHALRQESYLQKSKSRTEDRSSVSSDEKFDLSSNKINQIKPETKQPDIFSNNESLSVRKKGIINKNDCSDEKFKCTLTCLYLPNFSKGKPQPVRPPVEIQQNAISRTVSLERFECKSSWSSSAIIHDIESDVESMRLYFDLPMELIRATFNDASSPVATAFVFDKDRKEGLKNNRVREKGTKSHEAGRHVEEKRKPPYAKATGTGVNPQVAAKTLNIDWDSAATINNTETGQETDVPAALIQNLDGHGNKTAHKVKQRPKEEQNSESRELSMKKGCLCLALRPEMLHIKKPVTDMKTETVHKPKEGQNSESRESSMKKGCLCLPLRPEMLQIKNSDTDMKIETFHTAKQRPKEEENLESRESSMKKGCPCLALPPEMLHIKKPDTDRKTETVHKTKQRPKEEQNSESRESSMKKGCLCLPLRPEMLQIPDTDMKIETIHTAKQRPKEEENLESRESSMKKGCLCLAMRPQMLHIKKLDTDIKTETVHTAKQRPKEEQNSESRESSIKMGCPCLALRPGVTSRKVFSVCSSLSAGLPNTHKQKRSNQGLASLVQSKKTENWHSPCHYLHALRQESYLRKNKSLTENRSSASSDEKFDLSFSKINQIKPEMKQHDILNKNEIIGLKHKDIINKDDCSDEKFKCTSTCLYLPYFSRGKPEPVRPPDVMQKSAISRTVSLERFECESSWSSSAIINDLESDGESVRLYFDLPMELIRATFSDANSPVSTAFVFEGPRNNNVREKGSKSHEAGNHVPFSMSRIVSSLVSKPDSPTYCITPRSLKARKDFDAYLEAQSV